MKYLAIAAALMGCVLPLHADWNHTDMEIIRRSFNVSSGSGGKRVLVGGINGYIHVTGYGGSELRMTATKHMRAESEEALVNARREVKLDISQQGNFVQMHVEGPFGSRDETNSVIGGLIAILTGSNSFSRYSVWFDFDIDVPMGTEMLLSTVNGEIRTDRTVGDFEVRSVNGRVDLERVTGSGTVDTVNGPVTARFTRNPSKESAFKTVNGQMDFYFQPALDVNLNLNTFNGHIYTDFEVAGRPFAVDAQVPHGNFLDRHTRTIYGRSGRGGPQLNFDTLNGNIGLHRVGQ